MRSCHTLSAGFDDPNLVSCAGLIPVMTLAGRAGLHDLAATHVRVPGSAGSSPDVKVAALVAGMVADADSIDDMDLLRHGGMDRVFTAGRAPSTLGTFLRAFTFAPRAPARRGDLAGAGEPGRADTAAGRRRPGRLPRHRRHDPQGLRVSEAGRWVRVLQGQGFERAPRGRLDPVVGAGDRRDPAAAGGEELREGRGPPGRRRPGHRGQGRGHGDDHRACRQCVLQP